VIAASLLLILYNKHNVAAKTEERQEIYDMIDTVCLIFDGLAPFSKLAQRGAALLEALRPRNSAGSRRNSLSTDHWQVNVLRRDDAPEDPEERALDWSPPRHSSERLHSLDQTFLALPLNVRDECWTFTTDEQSLGAGQYNLSGLLFADNDLQNVFETDLDWGESDPFTRNQF